MLLSDAGRTITDADPEALRAVHGALIINLRNIVDAMSDAAVANPMRRPPVPLARTRRSAAS